MVQLEVALEDLDLALDHLFDASLEPQLPDGFEYGLLELSKWAWTLLLYNSSDFIFSELYCKNSVTSEDQVGPWNLAQHTLRLFLFITSTRNVYQPFHLFSDTF